MPLLRVTTNQSMATTEARADFLAKSSAELAGWLGKPERYCMVALQTGADLLFAGSDEPAALVELASLGLPEDRTGELSAAVCALLEEQLGVPPDRVYVHFQDVARHMWGTNATTFG